MKKYQILIFTILIFSSCVKDNGIINQIEENTERIEKNMMPAILQHYQTLTQPTSGAVQFSLYRTLATKNEADGGSLRFAANILNDNGESQDFGTISLGTTSINSDANNGYDYGGSIQDGRQYFGTIQNISVGNIISNESLYIPKEIHITNFDQTPGNRPTIQAGTAVEWNEDDKNSLGVLVVVEYLAIDNLGQGIEDVKDVKLVDDDGSFTFAADFLNKFPNNSILSVSLYRGNYKIVTATDGREILLYNYSQMTGRFNY